MFVGRPTPGGQHDSRSPRRIPAMLARRAVSPTSVTFDSLRLSRAARSPVCCLANSQNDPLFGVPRTSRRMMPSGTRETTQGRLVRATRST